MICLQPSWITTKPSRQFLAEHCRSQSLGSLEHLKIMDMELPSFAQVSADQTPDTTKVFHVLHLRKNDLRSSTRSSYKTKVDNTTSTYTKDTAYTTRKFKTLNGPICRTKTTNDITTGKCFFATSQDKQQKIKKIIKWIQRNGRKMSNKVLRNSNNLYKKQETTATTQQQSLSDVLAMKEATRAFREFLLKEMSAENLDFWLQVEAYKTLKPSQQKTTAAAIFRSYIAPGSPNEVNLDSLVQKQTREKLSSPDSTSFDFAQSQIFKLMENDSFRRFTKLCC